MDIDALIAPQSVHYEELLLKDPDNESIWLDYYELLQGDFLKSQFVLHRAVTQLPASTLLWSAYLLLPWSKIDSDKLLSVFETALLVLNPTPSLWLRYLTLAMDSSSTQFVLSAFNKALMTLDEQYHGAFWKKILPFADVIGEKEAASLYERFFSVSGRFSDGPEVMPDQCVLQIAKLGEVAIARELLCKIQESKLRLSQPLSLVVLKYCDILVLTLSFADSTYFSEVITDAIIRFPEMKPVFYLKQATYFALRRCNEKAHHFFSLGLNSSETIKQMVAIFNSYADFQEEEVSTSVDAEDGKILDLRMEIYEQFLKDHPRFVNDVSLRQDQNNVDHWLERAKLFDERNDKNETLKTLVRAIVTINPLSALSATGRTMADLWIHYANIYISQEDFETSNIIFSKAVKSQFKTSEELADIHISWTESLLQSADDNVALTHLEEILFVSPPEGDDENLTETPQQNLYKCLKLWNFYIDLLRSIYEDGKDESILRKWNDSFTRMSSLRIITIKSLLEFADFLQEQNLWARSFSVYESGLKTFIAPEAKYEIYKEYISKVLEHEKSNTDSIRDLFDHCITQKSIPGYLAKSIYLKYFEFEKEIGATMKSIKIIQLAIAYLTSSFNSNTKRYSKPQLNKIADDKFELYQLLISSISKLKDDSLQREIFSKSIQDSHLTLPQIIELGMMFISFETRCKEIPRARGLFKHLTGFRSPDWPIMSSVWSQWEKFELEYGTEDTYKDMLRFKRNAIKEFKELDMAKQETNPMGFVKGQTNNAITDDQETSKASNPDAIDLDLDM